MAELIQKVYAEALFGAALEDGVLDTVRKELDELNGLFGESPEFLTMLSSPALTPAEKGGILETTFGGKVEAHLYNFLRILADKGRASAFPAIAEEFHTLCRDHDGVILVEASTAVPMTEEQKTKLSEKLCAKTGKKIELKNIVDPALLGGMVLRYEGSEIDGSVKERIHSLRRRLQNTIA